MTVTAAAELLNIGRPGLSRVLNGKAALSLELAERIQHAFGFPAEKLLKMQASYNSETSNPAGLYVPPFLHILARQIERWASENNEARRRLPVLLRILVNSTASGLKKVDFSGNEDAERPGWDGTVEADSATPWISQGSSCWEFGCGKDIKRKADSDFKKRTGFVPEIERLATTFVFVTPRKWIGKNDWERTRREERQWGNVRVFDASDLEQWIEQSIPAQIWFAHETGISSEGVFSLEQCWKHWQADCEPALAPSLFDQALMESKNRVERWLADPPGEPLKIAADSTAEALAYLHVVFSEEEPLFQENRDRVEVFKEPGILPDLLSAESGLIVVSTSPETERELAPYRKSLKAILVYSQNMANVNPDITLKPLNYSALDNSLKEMGFDRDDIDRYRRECGYSLTVLRRRLSRLPKVRTPQWAGTEHAEKLIPMVLAGAWNSSNETDNFLVSELADGMDVESEIRRLSQLEDSPVWSFDSYRGVKSKIDALFAASESVTASHIERFFQVAEIVLSEYDPALDLHGKSREISDLLRGSVINSFVLLAVHGNELFRERIGFDIEIQIQKIIRELLEPLTARTLEDQCDALPAYAEAAPGTFLSIIEQDIDENEGKEVFDFFRPISTSSSGSPSRAEMLWALESLAWSGEYLARVARILARIAEEEIADNWANSATNSLSAIFRSWIPQTSVPVNKRIEVFNRLLEERRNKEFHDSVVWSLCIEQLNTGHRTGHCSYKPKWRTDGHEHGEPATENENLEFIRNAARQAIDWQYHTKETLADLIQCLGPPTEIPYEWLPEVWKLTENWHNEKSTSDSDRAWLYEIMHASVDFRIFPEARRIYEMLEPSDPILEHRWLFRKFSVPRAKKSDYLKSTDFRKHAEKIKKQRISALHEIHSKRGVGGLIELARYGEGQMVIGGLSVQVDSFDDNEAKALVLKALDGITEENSQHMERLIAGTLGGLEDACLEKILEGFSEAIPEERFLKILLLAPFGRKTWEFADKLPGEGRLRYWKEVNLRMIYNPSEVNEAVEKLIQVKRPREAVFLLEYDLKIIEPRRVLRLLETIVKIGNEEQKNYQVNLDQEFVEEAFKYLDERADTPSAQILNLEFEFVNFLERSERGMRVLERKINEHPELFAEMVVLAYRRDDGQEDKVPSSVPENIVKNRAWKMYRSIKAIRRLPGRDEFGNLNTERLIRWIFDVRGRCERRGRLNMGDICIGSLLSNSPEGNDGIWPFEPVRDALEKIYSEHLGKGFTLGSYDSCRIHIGHGGDPERAIENKHKEWAQRTQYSHPKTSKMLREIAEHYSDLGRHYDIEAEKFYRQLSF